MMELDEALRAVAHPARRQLLHLVADREHTVGELAQRVGLSQPATSQQLGVLRDAGLVTTRPDGNRRLYRVDVERLAELRAELDQLWSGAQSGLKLRPRPSTSVESVFPNGARSAGRGDRGIA